MSKLYRKDGNFCNRILWFIVSNVFLRSINEAIVYSFLFTPSNISSVSSATVDIVDLPFRKPPCLVLKSSLSSIIFYKCVCINVFAILPGSGNKETGLRLFTSVGSPLF